MATYPVINKETGEQKNVSMSVHDWSQWCEDNPDWQRDWSDPSTCPQSGEVGDWQDKLRKKNPGWNDVLSKVKKPQVLTSAISKYARKKRNKGDAISGIGSMSSRQLKRKKPINSDSMVDIKPLTDNQERFLNLIKRVKIFLHMVQQAQVRHSSHSTLHLEMF